MIYDSISRIWQQLGFIWHRIDSWTTLDSEKKLKDIVERAKQLRSNGEIISVANQKGGVGKTTTSISLSACFSRAGCKILLIDMDPQANSTLGLGIDKKDVKYTISEALFNDLDVEDIILSTNIHNLDIIPSNIRLAVADIELVNTPSREARLAMALDGIRNKYDYVIIDCPPAMSLLSINSLTATDSVIIPVQCEYYAIEGLNEFIDVVELVHDRLNPSLNISGILLTMYDPRIRHTNQIIDKLRKSSKNRIYKTIIPRDEKFIEASSFGKPIAVYAPYSRGARAYTELANELLKNG